MVQSTMDETASLYEFVGIGELAETTTHLLALSLQQSAGRRARSDMGQVEHIVLQQARDHLLKVREGFMLSVRAGHQTHHSELRYMLDRVLTDWSQLSEELGLDAAPDDAPPDGTQGRTQEEGEISDIATDTASVTHLERVRHQLLAFSMAVIALGHLPRLPAQQITFPHSYSTPPTYSDIPVPSTPAEMLWRIEELEKTVWRLMADSARDLVQRHYGPLRRTYGFFEASAYLSRKEAERFGVKERQGPITTF